MPSTSTGQSACDMLIADHREVAAMAESFDKAQSGRKKQIAAKICQALAVHATIEEEIFYPAVRESADEELLALLDEAEAEHEKVKELVSEIESLLGSAGNDDMLEAKVAELTECVDHHVQEEEDEMFPLVKDADIEEEALGERLARRKVELQKASSRSATPNAAE